MKRLALIGICSMLAVTGNTFADNLKIGVVNIEQVVQKSPLAVSYNEKISKDFKPRQDALNSAQKKLQDDMDQLNYGSFKMTTADRASLQTRIAGERRDFETLSAALQKDLAATQGQYTQDLLAKLGDVITKLAQSGHFDLIQTNTNLLYLNSSIDLTQQVIQQLK